MNAKDTLLRSPRPATEDRVALLQAELAKLLAEPEKPQTRPYWPELLRKPK